MEAVRKGFGWAASSMLLVGSVIFAFGLSGRLLALSVFVVLAAAVAEQQRAERLASLAGAAAPQPDRAATRVAVALVLACAWWVT